MEKLNNIPKYLLEKLNNQYDNDVVNKIIDGYSEIKKVTLRVNNLKTNINIVTKILEKENIQYSEVLWYKNAIIIENTTEEHIKKLDIYKNGEIYLQNLSSMIPPIVLSPKENTDILDMAAAPGGKTTQIASLTQNKAHITACEINNIRVERLKYNIEKQGTTCVSILKKDARTLDDFFSFDNILLDAPCSGSGTINLNELKTYKNFSSKLVEKSCKSQIALLNKAINILKSGKELVYSTCSILQDENENIVKSILENRNIELVNIEFEGKEEIPLLPCKIKEAMCVCPTNLYEGFFVVKLRKK